MIRSTDWLPRFVAVGGTVLLLAACDGPTSPGVEPVRQNLLALPGPVLVECPTAETQSVSKIVGLLGGTVSLDGYSVTLPFGAVLLPTEIELTIPASRYVEVQLRANGAASFMFREPVSITMSYDRCTRDDLDEERLTVWKIDPETKSLLKFMGGDSDPVSRTVQFESSTFSNYAIAN